MTLGVGIITSFFTAVMVTRLIVITWLNTARPRKLASDLTASPSHARGACYGHRPIMRCARGERPARLPRQKLDA